MKNETENRHELQQHYEKYNAILQNLTIMSDVFMRNVFKQWECTEYVLQVILQKKKLKIIDQVLQKDFKNLHGRSAILDCVAIDAEGHQYNVEIQQDSEGASPKRARYHSGLMDINTLNAGQDFSGLPESYVIFITRDDSLGYGLPICHVERTIEEVNEAFRDGSHIIYVNSKNQDDTELGRLMHDLNCQKPEEMYSTVLAKRVQELKSSQKEGIYMCQELEQLYNEGIAEGYARGTDNGIAKGKMLQKRETALSMFESGFPLDQITQLLKVSSSMLQDWISEGASPAN